MKALTIAEARERLAAGYALDRLWGETMGLPDGDSKEKPLRLVAQLLERECVPYALIGGVAVQLHTEEPRSTLDIDLAVPTTQTCRARPSSAPGSNTPAVMTTATTGAHPARVR